MKRYRLELRTDFWRGLDHNRVAKLVWLLAVIGAVNFAYMLTKDSWLMMFLNSFWFVIASLILLSHSRFEKEQKEFDAFDKEVLRKHAESKVVAGVGRKLMEIENASKSPEQS